MCLKFAFALATTTLAVTLVGSSLSASAATWSGFYQAYVGDTEPQTPVTGPGIAEGTAAGVPGFDASSTAVATVTGAGGPTPSVSVAASTTGSLGNPVANTRDELMYEIEIVGPSSSNPVPLSFSGAGSLTATSLGTSSLELDVSNIGGDHRYLGLSLNGLVLGETSTDALSPGLFNPGSFTYADTANEIANQPISIEMLVLASAEGCCSVLSSSATASLDPYFFISGPGSSLYTIEVLTDGIGNGPVSSTPLPSTWTMLIAGFIGLGFASYRGAKKTAAALAEA